MRPPLALALLASCASEVEIREDRGTVCVLPAGTVPDEWGEVGSVEFTEGVRLVADYTGCYGNSCAFLIERNCSVEELGARSFRISTYEEVEVERGLCDDLCKTATDSCEVIDAAEVGEYSLSYGSQTKSLVVPSTSEPLCFRQ